jgi:hypothetical protein
MPSPSTTAPGSPTSRFFHRGEEARRTDATALLSRTPEITESGDRTIATRTRRLPDALAAYRNDAKANDTSPGFLTAPREWPGADGGNPRRHLSPGV